MARWGLVAIEDLFDVQGRVEHSFERPCLREDAPLIEGGDLRGVGAAAALMLLFAGTASATVRTIGFPPRLLSIDEFVLGLPGVWSGVIGPATRERDPSGTVRVVAELDIDGMPVVAERKWIFDGLTFEETVRVDGADFPSNGDAAARLAQILPAAAAPLFLMNGAVVRDMVDHPRRSRSALDVISCKPFLDALLRTLCVSASSSGPSWNSMTATAAPILRDPIGGAPASRSTRRDRILHELRTTKQELERLSEALGPDIRTSTTPTGNLPPLLAQRHRAWLDRSKPPAPSDRDEATLKDLSRMPEALATTGTGWAELRFIEVSASAERLEHQLSEFPEAGATQAPPVSTEARPAGDQCDERSMRDRLIDCLREFAVGVRERRAIQVSDRLERHDPCARLAVDGRLLLTKPGGWNANLAELDLVSRETIGFALVEAFANLSGHRLPVVVDDAFTQVSSTARDLAITTFFGGRDG